MGNTSKLGKALAAATLAALSLTASGSGASSRGSNASTGKQKHPASSTHSKATSKGKHTKASSSRGTARSRARAARLKRAFIASSQLRPMAQQLNSLRTPAAYAGVLHYAQTHPGDGASAAYLALGHAYLLDHRFPEAVNAFHAVNRHGPSLADYADYLAAQALIQSGQTADALKQLSGFAQKYPDSVFTGNLPVVLATLQIQSGDAPGALHTLQPALSSPISNHADFQYALASAYQAAGDQAKAAELYRHLYSAFPLSNEAAQARTQLQQMSSAGQTAALTYAEREAHGNALLAGKRYSDAAGEFHWLASDLAADSANAPAGARNRAQALAAYADFKRTRHVNRSEAEAIEDAADESGALRLYLLMEDARSRDDITAQRKYVDDLAQRFSTSRWRDAALFSSGNMYLLKKDYPSAIGYFLAEATSFPASSYAPYCHWKAAWLNYRTQNYAEAARLFDEQIARYAGGQEIPAALYWRARVYEEQEHKPQPARAYYDTLTAVYQGSYYAMLARTRTAGMEGVQAEPVALLSSVTSPHLSPVTDELPDDDPHLAKARLLANAGLNEYISAEVQMSPTSFTWGALAQAEIYASYGETARAMRILKSAVPQYFSAPFDSIPATYWDILFPLPYAPQLRTDSENAGLDPLLVASLIRQESEWNPQVISGANAYGLMQLLPSVGKQIAKQQGIHHFNPSQLLDAATNLRLGTLYFRQNLDHFDGHVEYALAAYNAGIDRVEDWKTIGTYHDMPEFVESIPFSETRDYVQAILRNLAVYRRLHPELAKKESSSLAASLDLH